MLGPSHVNMQDMSCHDASVTEDPNVSMISVFEISVRKGCSKSSVYNAIESGDLKIERKIGSIYAIKNKVLSEWLPIRRKKKTAEANEKAGL